MAILKRMLVITAILGATQSSTILPATKIVTKPTPIVGADWMETSCVSQTIDTGDYQNAYSSMTSLLGSGFDATAQNEIMTDSGAVQAFICNNEQHHNHSIGSTDFIRAMGILDSNCGGNVAGYTREHKHNVDMSYGRDVYPNEECGFPTM